MTAFRTRAGRTGDECREHVGLGERREDRGGRGDDAGEEGDVVAVDLKDAAVHVEGVTLETADGEEVPRQLDASNLRVTSLDLSDDLREERLENAGEEDNE